MLNPTQHAPGTTRRSANTLRTRLLPQGTTLRVPCVVGSVTTRDLPNPRPGDTPHDDTVAFRCPQDTDRQIQP
jgi:hypothetical protein